MSKKKRANNTVTQDAGGVAVDKGNVAADLPLPPEFTVPGLAAEARASCALDGEMQPESPTNEAEVIQAAINGAPPPDVEVEAEIVGIGSSGDAATVDGGDIAITTQAAPAAPAAVPSPNPWRPDRAAYVVELDSDDKGLDDLKAWKGDLLDVTLDGKIVGKASNFGLSHIPRGAPTRTAVVCKVEFGWQIWEKLWKEPKAWDFKVRTFSLVGPA